MPPLVANTVNVLVMFGTRPEAIKLAPVIAALRRRPELKVRVAVTSQHRELLSQVLSVFALVPDADLQLMQPGQSLAGFGGRVLGAVEQLLETERPDLVIVQGDTSSAFLAGLSAFYLGVPVAHVEAGLRTETPQNPFPEEMNRRLLSRVALLHFAPTEGARRALLREGVATANVFLTGNTVVDALRTVRDSAQYRDTKPPIALDPEQRLILVTLHRRESWSVLPGICRSILEIVERRADVRVALPVHPNPAVHAVVTEILGNHPRVTLLAPLDYFEFLRLMDMAMIVMSDSGGVQEEAPVFGRPVLVLRDNTERPEAVEAGVSKVVGTEPSAIVSAALHLLDDRQHFERMAKSVSPFGDGTASEQIAAHIVASADLIARYAAAAGNPRAMA